MDKIGELCLKSTHGYTGCPAQYITDEFICFVSGNAIKFIKEDGTFHLYPFQHHGFGALAVHSIHKVFAYSLHSINPSIFIVDFPSFSLVNELKGGAKLEYTNLAFSTSAYLGSFSGIPNNQFILWDYVTNKQLTTFNLDGEIPKSLSFDPANWRHICITTEKDVSILSIEKSNDVCSISRKLIKLPSVNAVTQSLLSKDEPVTRASTRMSLTELPLTSIAGVSGDEVKLFEDYLDTTERVIPSSACWTTSGDVIIGCLGGQLLRINGENYQIAILYNPIQNLSSTDLLYTDKFKARATDSSDSITTQTQELSSRMTEGCFNQIALHKKGLFAAGTDKTLRLLDITLDKVTVVNLFPLSAPVCSLAFDVNFSNIVLGCNDGSLNLFSIQENKLSEYLCYGSGSFTGVTILSPGLTHAVTSKDNGLLQVWEIESSKLISSFSLKLNLTSLGANPLSRTITVGTITGEIYFLDYNRLDEPRVIDSKKLFTTPVNQIRFSDSNHFIFVSANSENLFVLDSRATTSFQVLGYLAAPGEIHSVSSFYDSKTSITKVAVSSFSAANNKNDLAATEVLFFNLPDKICEDPKSFHNSLKCDLNASSIGLLRYHFATPSNGVEVTSMNSFYTLCEKNKCLHKITIPDKHPKKETSKDSYLKPDEVSSGIQLPSGKLLLSPHKKWLAMYGLDGFIRLKSLANMEKSVDVLSHSYRTGGVRSIAFSLDSQHLLTIGCDQTFNIYLWRYSNNSAIKEKNAADWAASHINGISSVQQKENDFVVSMPQWNLSQSSNVANTHNIVDKNIDPNEDKSAQVTPVCDYHTQTWLQLAEKKEHDEQDNQLRIPKNELRAEIKSMREQLQNIMKENQNMSEIDQLGHDDFDLDVEEQTKLREEGETEVQKIREEKEFDNLAKEYLTDIIKVECWDKMVVKGRGLQAFNSNLITHNYPMKERTQEEKALLKDVLARRSIEVEEANVKKELVEIKTTAINIDDNLENEEGENGSKERPSTTGSLGGLYGGGCNLFYSQFEMHTREQKINQIVLLDDTIYRIRTEFNKSFDSIFEKKEQEILKIREKNKRIRKIYDDLGLALDLQDPELSIVERPELLLTVNDNEVKVERFLNENELKAQKELEKIEEQRRLAEKKDNWRDRGLDCMMGGRLEIKKEDELKKEIPVPAFITNKPDVEWSEDEQRLALEYEKKVKDLQEEREKYKKQLEMELKKIQTQIQEGMEMFDESLLKLFQLKVKTEMVIYQEELKIVRIKQSILMEEELNNREFELQEIINHKRILRQSTSSAFLISRKNVEDFREYYDILVAEDKVMDKAFKREIHDVPAFQMDQLYKLFRRRPRGQKVRGPDTPFYDPTSGNPFAERPSTARQNQQANEALSSALTELDDYSNAPEGVDEAVWNQVCKLRHEKIEREQLIKQKALILAEMNAFLQNRQDEDEKLKTEMEEILQDLNRLREVKQHFINNLEVQLLMKQGQVEVDPGSFIHNFQDSILVHRNVIEELNGKICQLGQTKIASMIESKDFRKGIIGLEWEHRKMTMEMEDLENKMRDIQMLKVTRELQAYLNEEDHDAKKAQEIGILEQTVALMKQHHEKNCAERTKILKDFKRIIKDKTDENNQLGVTLEELNVTVCERKNIHKVNADKNSDAGREKRYMAIVQRRRLVDLAKAQAQEVAVLRAEVERLRMRTFPALVQVEH